MANNSNSELQGILAASLPAKPLKLRETPVLSLLWTFLLGVGP